MSGKREKKLRKEIRKEIDADPGALASRCARLEDICRRLKAREARLSVGLLAFKVAWNRKDVLAVNKFAADLLSGDLAEAVACTINRDLAVKTMLEALSAIARSAPCKEGHESFNTPGQPCDQRLADQAIERAKSLDPYFWFNHDGSEPERGVPTPEPAAARALVKGGTA